MRFEILHDAFSRQGEMTPYGTIPLRATKTKRDYFLDESAKRLLELGPGEHDFDEEFGNLDKAALDHLRDGLGLLAAFGGARILPQENRNSSLLRFRVAGEKDYRAASALILSNGVRRLGLTEKSEEVMNEDDLRARQFNNLEYLFLCFRESELAAVMIAAVPKPESFSAAFRLYGVVISESLSETEANEAIQGLWAYTAKAFRDEFSICRYLCFSDNDAFLPVLLNFGFRETAHLKKETFTGGDVTVYDCSLSREGQEPC